MDMKENIIHLFKKYGFEYRKLSSNHDFLAFTFRSGFFHNAELVSLEDESLSDVQSRMDNVARDMERLGFSTKKSFYKSFEDIEKTLFDGFFNVIDWKEKIKSEYMKNCEKIISVLPKEADNYVYIQGPYLKNNKKSNEKNIISDICNGLLINGPQLSIIEAPAGFGKTCTSYEIINHLANNDDVNSPIPFFSEFSRDRQARVFSHIFVREVDRSFSSVNSDVVIEEVKSGRIVVVLDGFDELLHDSNVDRDADKQFESAEPMLETISELLTRNAKVILSSRRSAIFDGALFNEWFKKYDGQFKINRYRLERPEVKDWLPEGRLEKLQNTCVNVENLSNPVLLSFLRFVNDDFFSKLCQNPDLIVSQYFLSMLEREMDRQELRMSPEKQSKLLMLVAEDMYSKNYTSDSKDKIINLIKDQAAELLNEVRASYSAKDKPTIDKLATTLSNHAFFDRSDDDENHIEFINEFVFGNYIAENIINSTTDWLASDERFVEPAVLSYLSKEKVSRDALWNNLAFMKNFLDSSSKMKFEAELTGQVIENTYHNSEISSVNFKSICMFGESSIKNSIFNSCVFSSVKFFFDNFDDITFFNCSFWDCDFELNDKNIDLGVNFCNCKSNNELIERVEVNSSDFVCSENVEGVIYYILSKLWPIGSNSIENLYYFIGNLFKSDGYSKKDIVKGIKKLKKMEILLDAKDVNFVLLNKTKINEIKDILKRK